ncbi:helix-turn-helix domain-containing protein [Sphingomicrobium flavum]|uniref:helix-turn-helix domain-containing protein n=1 Tax=Sphingomicrobium flavum TaxID=1229164 RepID=UPI0021ADDAC1|nr:helix-turn-helix domain-containing protein [Sphingomicrobium flavum]
MEKLLVSVGEAMQMLGVGRNTLYDLLNAGEIRSRMVGRRRLIEVTSLREYAAEAA